LSQKKVLLLGDDDLLSIAIHATEILTDVMVVDLDVSLLTALHRWCESSRINVICHDLRLELPLDHLGAYDLVFTDPPYTLPGQLKFLQRAIASLRPVHGSELYVCSSRLYLDQTSIDRIIQFAEMAGFCLSECYEGFNEYEAPPDVARDMQHKGLDNSLSVFRSALFKFTAVRIPFTIPDVQTRDIYSYEESSVSS